MQKFNKTFKTFSLIFLVGLFALTTSAGSTLLTVTKSDTSTSWFVANEPALVMNGFDLSNLALPVTIDAVTINVSQAVAGQPVSVLVYEDSNGGSPQDAKLISRTDVSISSTGLVRIPINPVTTSSKVIWAGFYLPVDFRFLADTSGTSVLTYWAWTPGTVFDPANLATAGVFGPADGSAPVSINMGGIARIAIELNQANGQTSGGTGSGVQTGVQIVGDPNTSLSVMSSFPTYCPNITYDTQDILVSGNGQFSLHCNLEPAPMQPGVIGNSQEIPSSIPGFERRGLTYQVFANGEYGLPGKEASYLRVPVTICIVPNAGDLEKAVIGVAYSAPQKWFILPTVRYGTSICAELTNMGPVSYFVPRTGQETYLNANMVFVSTPKWNTDLKNVKCFDNISFEWAIKNDGFDATPATIVRVTNVATRTGQTTKTLDINLPAIPPGTTIGFSGNFEAPNTFINESQRLVFTIDPTGAFNEINENDNSMFFEYVLKPNAKNCTAK